ncbi:MAG: CvpA family protein [Clostridia bacterium]
MSIIIDLVIVAIIALCILLGYRKGLTGSLLKIVSFVLALIIAFILFKPVSNFVIDNTNWDENLEQAIRQSILEQEETPKEDKEQTKQSMPDVMMNYINEAVENAGNEAKNAIIDATARDISVTIINVAVAIVLFIISKIILLFIKGLANLLTKLPVIKQFDKLGGILFGLLQSLIIIYIIFAIISLFSPMMDGTGIIEGIKKSFIGSMMYDNNLLLKIIF